MRAVRVGPRIKLSCFCSIHNASPPCKSNCLSRLFRVLYSVSAGSRLPTFSTVLSALIQAVSSFHRYFTQEYVSKKIPEALNNEPVPSDNRSCAVKSIGKTIYVVPREPTGQGVYRKLTRCMVDTWGRATVRGILNSLCTIQLVSISRCRMAAYVQIRPILRDEKATAPPRRFA